MVEITLITFLIIILSSATGVFDEARYDYRFESKDEWQENEGEPWLRWKVIVPEEEYEYELSNPKYYRFCSSVDFGHYAGMYFARCNA